MVARELTIGFLFFFWITTIKAQSICDPQTPIDSTALSTDTKIHTELPEKPGWVLSFHDEFDAPKLSPSKWNDRYISSPKLENPDLAAAYYLIKEGILHLRMDRELPHATHPEQKHSRVSSIETAEWLDPEGKEVRAHFAQKYGWFEIRSRMPQGSGLHSAFWLLLADHIDWKTAKKERKIVEIDIFEQLGKQSTKHEIEFNLHFTKAGPFKYNLGFDPSLEFHTYALEWREGKLLWYVDDKMVWEYTGKTPESSMFVLLGLYEGSGWTGEIDPDMGYPRDFEIDYVRVYKRKDVDH